MTAQAARVRAAVLKRSGTRGQAMIETVVVMFVLCLAFFLIYEYASLFMAHTVVNYAAARAARARAVGFNDFMVTKTVRIATMSMAGRCLTHDDDGSDMETGTLISRAGSYLEAEWESDTRGILDFEYWDSSCLGWTCSEPGGAETELTMRVWQRRALYRQPGGEGSAPSDAFDDDLRRLEGEAGIESHYPFYLQ